MKHFILKGGAEAPNNGIGICAYRNTDREAASRNSTKLPITGGFASALWTRVLIPLLLFVFAMPMVMAQDEYFPTGNGDGTAENPFQITSAAELATFAELVNAGFTFDEENPNAVNYLTASYKLMNDIDLDGKKSEEDEGWTPIGGSTYDTGAPNVYNGNPFLGIFDGNGKKITGLYIKQEGGHKGLFGRISGVAATIRNLGVVGDVTNTAFAGNAYSEMVGGIVGSVQGGGLIENCWFSGSVTGVRGTIGGITGFLNPGIINKCWSDATVANTPVDNGRVGGIAGSIESGGNSSILSVVNNCYFSGKVISGTERNGGIVGSSNPGRVSNCYVTGDVEGNAWGAGGIVGFVQSNTIVENCYITGTVSELGSENHRTAGIVGRANNADTKLTIRNCVVLSLEIKGGAADVTARIHGQPENGNPAKDAEENILYYRFTYANNYAWEGVKNVSGASGEEGWGKDRFADNRQGADVSVLDIRAAGFFKEIFETPYTDKDGEAKWEGTLFEGVWDEVLESSWSYPGGSLPNLFGETVFVPLHLSYEEEDVEEPVITTHPLSQAVAIDGELTLSVAASSPDGGGLSYQWYSNDSASNEGGTAIEGATEASFEVNTEEGGVYYFYVAVTNGFLNGDEIVGKTVISNVATVTITNETIYYLTIEVSPEEVDNVAIGTAGYLEGATVTIKAGDPSGYTFSRWETDDADIVFASATSKETTFVMPDRDVTITAVYVLVTSSKEILANPLKAWVSNGVLNVSGLSLGKIWRMYDVTGAQIMQGVADGEQITIGINVPSGLYIIKSETHTVKVLIVN